MQVGQYGRVLGRCLAGERGQGLHRDDPRGDLGAEVLAVEGALGGRGCPEQGGRESEGLRTTYC